jgi:hypothetical protein
MGDRLKLGREALMENIAIIERAYYGSVYRITKAALEPVVAATGDVIRESVSVAVREGVKDALSPTDFIGDLIFGRRRRK